MKQFNQIWSSWLVDNDTIFNNNDDNGDGDDDNNKNVKNPFNLTLPFFQSRSPMLTLL